MALLSQHLSGNSQLQAAAGNNPPLRKGASGDGVALLQQGLVDFGFSMPVSTSNGTQAPDGIFGDETFAVVKQFQTEQDLTADGIAGRDTITELDRLYLVREQGADPDNPANWSVTTARRTP